jgi:hypothetical protein
MFAAIPASLNLRVLCRIFVALGAMRYHLRSAKHVLAWSYGFKVLRVAASAVAAKMVKVHSAFHRTDYGLIH